MATDTQITLAVIGFFLVIAVLVFLRLLLRKGPPHWKQIRLGVYIERVPTEEDDSLAPTTLMRPER